MKIAICFETSEGHTARVADRIKDHLTQAGHAVEVLRCRDAGADTLDGVDGIIVGSSIHMGKHNKRAVRFAREHQTFLAARPAAFFTVCLTARSGAPDKQAEVQGYLDAFQEQTGWKPALTEAFAGALLYTQYGFIKRKIMLKIVRAEGGDVDPERDFVYTDWDAVDAFAAGFLGLLGG